jgi:signal peptidase I
MFKKIYNWITLSVEEKSVQREVVEIILFYVVLATIVIVQNEIPFQWFLLSLVLLLGMVFDSVRELLRVGLLAGIIVFGFVRPFVVQAFYIPSRSMENTLQVNDHIFVNKFIYFFTGPSRWDTIVFEYPRDPSKDYIKRLVGLPGDTVELRNNHIFLNGEPVTRQEVSSEVELFLFGSPKTVSDDNKMVNLRFQADGLSFNNRRLIGNEQSINPLKGRARVSRIIREAGSHSVKELQRTQSDGNNGTLADFGPLRIPRPGDTVVIGNLNKDELNCFVALLRQKYDQSVYISNGTVYRGGTPVEEIKIKEKLYFALGDNRDHSEDSRVWGFVPASRLEGRAFFIYWPVSRLGLISS